MTDSQYQILKIAVELAVTAQLSGDRIDRIIAIDDTLKNMSNKENVLSFKLASPCNACIYCNSEPQFNINI